MVNLVDVIAMSAKVEHGFSLSEEELLAAEEWYASLDGPSIEHHVAELDRMSVVATTRFVTDAEAKKMGWHAQRVLELAEPIPAGGGFHPLHVFITDFTKRTRPTQFFSANFKKVNAVVMPYAIAVFSRVKKI